MTTAWAVLLVSLWLAVLLLAVAVAGLARIVRGVQSVDKGTVLPGPDLRAAAWIQANERLKELIGDGADCLLLFLSHSCGACERLLDSLRGDSGQQFLADVSITVIWDGGRQEQLSDGACQAR
jgi:hypothetical protein